MVIKDQSPETKQLSDVIIELNIARKNVLSYPKGHPLIKATIDKAFNLLKKLLTVKNEATIGVAKDALMVGEEYLDRKNTVFRNFALALNRKAIASVTFLESLDKEEFVRFHDLISSEPKTDEAFEDIVSAVQKVEMENIKIKVLDYRAFRIIEERRFNAKQKADRLWDSFIRAFLVGLLDIIDYDEGDDLSGTLKISPVSVAEELNKKGPGEISQAFSDKTVANFLNQIGDSTEEHKINLRRLAEFIGNLKPELREQFLASTIKHLSEKPEIANDILSEFSEELIMDTLKIISEMDTNVPPTVLSLLQKLSETEQGEPTLEWERVERETMGDLSEDEIKKALTTVFRENSVSSDYSEVLTTLIASAQTPETTKSTEEMSKDIGKDNIEGKMSDVIFEILEKNISVEEFSKLIGKLKEMSVFFLETGQFDVLTKIYDTLASYAKSENEMRAKVSSEAIQCFSEQSFMEEVIGGFNLWEKEKYEDISILIRKVGIGFIPLLLDALSREKDTYKRNFLVKLIATFGAAAASKAIKRIEDADPYFVKKLIIILRQSNDRNLIPAVHGFIKHHDPTVQIEALRTLLHFKAPDVSTDLREKISSGDNEMSKSAIFLAGAYKVRDITDLLLNILRRRIFWGTNLEKREACVRTLGEIGDPAVLPELSKAFKAKSLFNRKALTKLRMSIIRSMEKYPLDGAAAFLETQSSPGRLRNSDLQKTCMEMLDKIMNKKAI